MSLQFDTEGLRKIR